MDWVRNSWLWVITGIILVWMLFKIHGHHGRRSAHEGGSEDDAHGGCCGGGEVDSDPQKREVGRPT